MNFIQFTFYFIGQVFSLPYSWAGIVTFIIGILFWLFEWRTPRKFNNWNSKIKYLPVIIPLAIFIILIPFSGLWSAYNLYKSDQKQLSKYQVQERPLIIINPSIKGASYSATSVNISAVFTFNNQGNQPAYNFLFRGCAVTLDNPQNILAADDIYSVNPIYKGVPYSSNFNYNGPYSTYNGTVGFSKGTGVILIYIYLKYSDSAENGIWYDDTFWDAFLIDFNNNQVALGNALPEWKILFEPVIKAKYQSSGK